MSSDQLGNKRDIVCFYIHQSENNLTMRRLSASVKISTRSTYEHRRDIRLVPNLSEKGNYNPILVWINKIPCVDEKTGWSGK